MKNLKYILILSLLFANFKTFASTEDNNPNDVVAALIIEINTVNHKYELLIDIKQYQLQQVNKALKEAISTEQKVDLLIEKDQIKKIFPN